MGAPQICPPTPSRSGWGYRLRGGGTGSRTAQKGRNQQTFPSVTPAFRPHDRKGRSPSQRDWVDPPCQAPLTSPSGRGGWGPGT